MKFEPAYNSRRGESNSRRSWSLWLYCRAGLGSRGIERNLDRSSKHISTIYYGACAATKATQDSLTLTPRTELAERSATYT